MACALGQLHERAQREELGFYIARGNVLHLTNLSRALNTGSRRAGARLQAVPCAGYACLASRPLSAAPTGRRGRVAQWPRRRRNLTRRRSHAGHVTLCEQPLGKLAAIGAMQIARAL